MEKKRNSVLPMLAMIVLLGTMRILCGGMTMQAQEVRYITTEAFRQQVFDYRTDSVWRYKGDCPCIVDFYTTWCGPCKRLAPIMEELAKKYDGKVEFFKADTERERELAYVFQISSIPQVLYVPLEGQPMLLKGLYPKENIEQIIEEFLLQNKENIK